MVCHCPGYSVWGFCAAIGIFTREVTEVRHSALLGIILIGHVVLLTGCDHDYIVFVFAKGSSSKSEAEHSWRTLPPEFSVEYPRENLLLLLSQLVYI